MFYSRVERVPPVETEHYIGNEDEPEKTKMTRLPQFPEFNVMDISNAGPQWKKYTSCFMNLCVAMDLKAEAVERKKALFLHYVGPAVYDIYDTMKAEGDKYKEVKQKLDAYFIPKCNNDFEGHLFTKTRQLEGETLDQYCTRLWQCAKTCGFTDVTVKSNY